MRVRTFAGALLAAVVAADAGDPAATERRLERAGAGTGLRLAALEAVARGASFLERAQRPDGTFLPPGTVNWYAGRETVPVDALCALALEEAGSDSSRAAAGRALERLVPAARGHAHAASFLARLALERRADPALLASLGRALAESQDAGSGLWVPRQPRPTIPFGTIDNGITGTPMAEIETAHAAILGLAAAESGQGRAPTVVWTRHLEALHRLQSADGGWKNSGATAVGDLASTAQAMAGLVLGREALLRRGPVPPRLGADIEEALAKGAPFLREEAADALWSQRRFPGATAGRTYLLFDLDKGLSFSGNADLDGFPPYESVARVLLDSQSRDGRWSAGGAPADDLAETAFALLALTRSAETLRTVPGPATAPRGEPAWPEDGAPPPATTVPRREAEEALDWLESLLRTPAASRESLRRTLLFTGRAYLRPADGEDAAFALRAEAAFLRALGIAEGPLAARLLGTTKPRVSAPMRRILAGDLPMEVLREGFASLGRLGDPASLRWLCEENLSGDADGPRFLRSREALRAIPLFRAAPGTVRKDGAERILALYEGLAAAANPYLLTTGKFDPTARSRWVACRRFVLDALLSLSRDPVAGTEPAEKGGGRIVTLQQYRQWFGDHPDPRRAPWVDR